MEDVFYNILWIDDEHETLGGTKGRAKRNGINLIPFKSLNGGISELERNYPFYDGVLLDAKFLENEDDTEGTEDTYNVHRAKERLLQLKKKFEIFVLTGQAEAYDDKTFAKAFPKVFKKGSDEETDRLFTEIKLAAACQEDTQLRHSYKRVFDVCTEKYIGEYSAEDILYLLKINNESEIEKNLSTIRDIVQDLFSCFHKFNLLPAEFVKPKFALNESGRFLIGKGEKGSFIEKGYLHFKETHLPKQIAVFLDNILAVVQPGSHRTELDDHIRLIRTHYLMKSVLYQLLDVLVWFKMYVDSNPKPENWKKTGANGDVQESVVKELINGKVIEEESLARRGKDFAFFQPDKSGDNVLIPSHLVSAYSLLDGMSIKVEVEEYTDSRSGELKTRVKRIEKLK
jgi:hypothetical protein